MRGNSHVRFGGVPLDKYPVGQLAGGLSYPLPHAHRASAECVGAVFRPACQGSQRTGLPVFYPLRSTNLELTIAG